MSSTISRLAFALVAIGQLAPAGAETIQWDAEKGSVRVLAYGETEAPKFRGTPAQAAQAFLAEKRDLFNGRTSGFAPVAGQMFGFEAALPAASQPGPTPEVAVTRVDEAGDLSFVRMNQTVDGLEVLGADMVVAVRRDGGVSSYQGSYLATAHDRSLAASVATATLDPEAAEAAALEAVGAEQVAESRGAQLVWTADRDGALKKAYRVDVVALEPRGDWRVVVDAGSGQILSKENLLLFASEATGKGRVYMSNPLRDPTIQNVTLERLVGNGFLESPFVKVTNGKAQRIQANDGNFEVEASSTHFAEVMGYFHMDRIHRNLKEIEPSFAGMDFRIPLEVHSKGSFFMKNDNAYYSPMQKAMFILDPKKLNDLHLEAAVSYHEYHHAVTDAIVPGLSSVEGKAMHEGYSDYFACSLDNDPEIGEWALQPLNRPNMRDLRSGRKYPQDLHPQREPHSDGEIWAAACWTLRERIGRTKADFLVHKSRSYISGSATFKSAYEGMLAADRDHFGGANQEAVTAVFTERGIAGSAPADAVAEMAERARFRALFAALD